MTPDGGSGDPAPRARLRGGSGGDLGPRRSWSSRSGSRASSSCRVGALRPPKPVLRSPPFEPRRSRMKKFLLLAALTAVGLSLVAGSSLAGLSSSGTLKTYIDNCGHHVMKPRRLVTACADGNYYLAGLAWKHWGRRKAHATGYAHVNDCKPNCASGKFKVYPVAITASKRHRCSGHRDYTKLTIGYTKGHPAG